MNKEVVLDNNHGESLWAPDESQHRFSMPDGIYRVTAGQGGESFLIDAGSIAGIYDCGMAYCHKELIENIKSCLNKIGKNKLDFVLISHSHYDHIGALPYIIKEWPDINVIGADKLKKVFSSEGAKKTMVRLGLSARDDYAEGEEKEAPITADGMRVDTVLQDGEEIRLGDIKVKAIWTPGHTDCSMSYLILPRSILFMSESVGVLENDDVLHTSILKSFKSTMESADKLENLNADVLICSHYGVVPKKVQAKYFDMYRNYAEEERDFILDLHDKGYDFDTIFSEYEKKYWTESRDGAQPKDAFLENAGHTINCIINEFGA